MVKKFRSWDVEGFVHANILRYKHLGVEEILERSDGWDVIFFELYEDQDMLSGFYKSHVSNVGSPPADTMIKCPKVKLKIEHIRTWIKDDE